MHTNGRLAKISRKLVLDAIPEACGYKRKALRFSNVKPLARLSLDESIGLFAPESRMAIVSVADDPAASDLMIGLGVSCAREGSSILFLSHNISLDEFLFRVYSTIAKGHYLSSDDEFPSLADIKLLDRLEIYHEGISSYEGRITEDSVLRSVEACDADLLILEGGDCSDLSACTGALRNQGIPFVYNRSACLEGQRAVADDFGTLPTHVVFMDRSMDEIEAEKQDRPYIGARECRLMIPDDQKHIMTVPFLGTFTVAYSPECHRIANLVDEYDGHLLSSDINEIELDGERYAIAEPDHYERRLELLFAHG